MIRVIGVPVGTGQLKWDFFVGDCQRGTSQACESAGPHERCPGELSDSVSLRTVQSPITHESSAAYALLIEWALTSNITGDGAAAAGLPTLEKVAK